jgi:transcriptional regulator with XRE-family HTH domain
MLMGVPSGTAPTPGPFARAVAAEIRSAMARQRMSGSALARKTDRSQSYLSKRLRDEVSFSANDLEDICEVLGEDLFELLRAAVLASRRSRTGHRPTL